jgi:hypothetical protein
MNLSLMGVVPVRHPLTAMPIHRLSVLLLVLPLGACLNVKTQPIEVKPIHITVDVNVQVKVERALQDFFGDIDRKAAGPTP